MFVDQVSIFCKAGDGGPGACSFRREAHIPRGGPDGGDGGRGGNVVIEADENVSSLVHLVGVRHWHAENGHPGQPTLKAGRMGEEKVIRVPPGTIIRDATRGFAMLLALPRLHALLGLQTLLGQDCRHCWDCNTNYDG
jgi:GTP-binding protein